MMSNKLLYSGCRHGCILNGTGKLFRFLRKFWNHTTHPCVVADSVSWKIQTISWHIVTFVAYLHDLLKILSKVRGTSISKSIPFVTSCMIVTRRHHWQPANVTDRDLHRVFCEVSAVCIDMNYNWTNNAYWLLRLRLKPAAWADQQYRPSVGHDFQKPNCSSAQCSASEIITLASGSSNST